MARTWLKPLHAGKGRPFEKAFHDIIEYVADPGKTKNGEYITGYETDWRSFPAQAVHNKMLYDQERGRQLSRKKDVLAYHFEQSFKPGEITPEEANRLGLEFAHRYTRDRHAFVVCTHVDKGHIHNHIIWDAVDLEHGKKFRNFWGSTKAAQRLSDSICLRNGYSVIDRAGDEKLAGKSYEQWLGSGKKPSHRDELRMAVDAALSGPAVDFESFLDRLREAGIAVERRGKALRLRAPGWKKFAEIGSLGSGYTEENLRKAAAGEQPKPRFFRPKCTAKSDEKIDLLVNLQNKILEGKRIGYLRWAKGFNLKQTVKTYNYLAEHRMTYAELGQRVQEATDRCHGLAGDIKKAEARMAEIAVLKNHIVNYSKTRQAYVDYRKAGYSRKFLAAHEAEIAAHKAAKAYFDQLNLEKLPTVKTLQAEYSRLLAQKKSDYAAYRQAREEMRELRTVKANLEQVLGGSFQQRSGQESER